jgi:hypothetical protein
MPVGSTSSPLMGQWLPERLGQPFVIENRPGGGNLNTELIARARADDYTLLLTRTPSRKKRPLNLPFNKTTRTTTHYQDT